MMESLSVYVFASILMVAWSLAVLFVVLVCGIAGFVFFAIRAVDKVMRKFGI